MKLAPLTLYSFAAVTEIAGSSGAAMLAPFFMKAQGYSITLAGIPLVVNGIGRVFSDLMSGVLATYFSSGALLLAATSIALLTSTAAMFFFDNMTIFLSAWTVLGLTEATFALAIRKIAFEQALAGQHGRAQGQVASALGIGFALGPLAGGLVGRIFGPNALFGLYALPQLLGLIFIVLGGAHRARTIVPEEQVRLWREGRHLLSQPWFLASCLAICQSFFFLVGVTRVAFPFLAANQRGMGLDRVGTIVSASRLADTLGRYTGGHLCDRVSAPLIIVTGVLIGIPMFALQPHGADFMTLLLPLCVMTLGFGFTNVGATTFALQSAGGAAKGISLGLTRASSSIGQMLGPLAAGALIDQLGYEQAFEAMATASLAVLVLVWAGLRVKPAVKQE